MVPRMRALLIAHCSSLSSAQCDGGPTATLFSPLGTSILGTVPAF